MKCDNCEQEILVCDYCKQPIREENYICDCTSEDIVKYFHHTNDKDCWWRIKC